MVWVIINVCALNLFCHLELFKWFQAFRSLMSANTKMMEEEKATQTIQKVVLSDSREWDGGNVNGNSWVSFWLWAGKCEANLGCGVWWPCGSSVNSPGWGRERRRRQWPALRNNLGSWHDSMVKTFLAAGIDVNISQPIGSELPLSMPTQRCICTMTQSPVSKYCWIME